MSDKQIHFPTGSSFEAPYGKVTVFPMGFKHIRKFSQDISRVIAQLVTVVDIRGGSEKIIPQLMPILMTDLLDLVADCVVIEGDMSIENLPHWDVAQVLEKWVIESFGTAEKRDPWIRAIERVVAQTTGEDVTLSEMFSKVSSKADTDSKTSMEPSATS